MVKETQEEKNYRHQRCLNFKQNLIKLQFIAYGEINLPPSKKNIKRKKVSRLQPLPPPLPPPLLPPLPPPLLPPLPPPLLPLLTSKTTSETILKKKIEKKPATKLKKKKFLSFENALMYMRSVCLNGQLDWNKWCRNGKRPSNIPSQPYIIYKDKGWINWGHFLGTGNTRWKKGVFLSFEETLMFVRTLNISNEKEWRKWSTSSERPSNIPSKPDRTYKDKGWINWGHFLGTFSVKTVGIKKEFVCFKEALEISRSFEINSLREWQKKRKHLTTTYNIPTHPDKVYKEFKGYCHWLGY